MDKHPCGNLSHTHPMEQNGPQRKGLKTLSFGWSETEGKYLICQSFMRLANRRIRPLCHLSGVRSYILPRLRRGPLPLQLHTFTYLWSYCTHSTGVVSLGVLGLVGEHMGSNPGFSIAEKKSDRRDRKRVV